MSSNLRIGFLGAGKMAAALAKGFASAGLVEPWKMQASDPVEAARDSFARTVGASVSGSNLEVVKASQALVLAVKPGQMPELLEEIAPALTKEHLVISIAAGISLAQLEAGLREGARVVRVMPNTPALVGASASAFALGRCASEKDGKLVMRLFSSLGVAFEIRENLLDAVTGLSGSGPAYAFMMIEALSDGGVACGLPREIATKLAAQTLLGAAKMVLETGQHPGALKEMVTSPGGTTIEGVHALEQGKFRATLMNAVRAAAEKSRKLGQSPS
jgi:pyrroline-5-carboxylate reductase